MRNGNLPAVCFPYRGWWWFLPYLWGMETYLGIRCNSKVRWWFLPYLWGMETEKFVGILTCWIRFLPYLWGMETSFATFSEYIATLVLTVPMRNGNITDCSNSPRYCLVLTVPMRNGNSISTIMYANASDTFLPYLWGMETLCNHVRDCLWHRVLTVPMRNGNSSVHRLVWLLLYRSYRTYEEWKLDTSRFRNLHVFSFLPYLWGMETQVFQCKGWFKVSSYRTYEEWKPTMLMQAIVYVWKVLTVPMRNGNPTITTHNGRVSVIVLTVPMRNGNKQNPE